MAKQYIVTWRPAGELDFLTIIDGVVELTVDQIMEIVLAVEDIAADEDHEICSIVRADNVDVIC
jgi:hypothetical protein